MKINWSNVKLRVTNYRWYIAVIWALLLLPVWCLPMAVISLISSFFAWYAMQLSDIATEMQHITQKYLTWAVRWFGRSLPKESEK